MTFARSSREKTSFFMTVSHNLDLCPRYEMKIDQITQAFKKYNKNIVCDVQGFRDCGTDVAVKVSLNKTETEHICFQIKSEDDLRGKDYLKDLKAQYFDTRGRYHNLIDYYILLCCDSIRNKDKIRTIVGEFSKEAIVHVIVPEQALTFYHIGVMYIDAVIKAKLGSEDVIFRMSLELVVNLTPTEKAILFFLIWSKIFNNMGGVTFSFIQNSAFIRDVYNIVPDYDKDWFFADDDGEADGECSEGDGDSHEEYDLNDYGDNAGYAPI